MLPPRKIEKWMAASRAAIASGEFAYRPRPLRGHEAGKLF